MFNPFLGSDPLTPQLCRHAKRVTTYLVSENTPLGGNVQRKRTSRSQAASLLGYVRTRIPLRSWLALATPHYQ